MNSRFFAKRSPIRDILHRTLKLQLQFHFHIFKIEILIHAFYRNIIDNDIVSCIRKNTFFSKLVFKSWIVFLSIYVPTILTGAWTISPIDGFFLGSASASLDDALPSVVVIDVEVDVEVVLDDDGWADGESGCDVDGGKPTRCGRLLLYAYFFLATHKSSLVKVFFFFTLVVLFDCDSNSATTKRTTTTTMCPTSTDTNCEKAIEKTTTIDNGTWRSWDEVASLMPLCLTPNVAIASKYWRMLNTNPRQLYCEF